MKCTSCKSKNVVKARNDIGFFKADGIKPARMYPYLCQDCGYIMTVAEV